MYNKKASRAGFTLIELMIVVAIMGIIAVVAYPSYQSSVQKSRRAEGKALVMDASNRQERRFADTNAYAIVMTNLGYTADPNNVNNTLSENNFYTLSATNVNGFTLTATAVGIQAVDTECATMSINALGAKDSTGGGDCW